MPASIFLTAEWRYLVMLNYAVDHAVLDPFVPQGTELDWFGDRTFASVVGFRFIDTRVHGLPVPFHTDFEEVNLRFYVRRRADDGWRRGVVFVRELVPRRAIAYVARTIYGEPYMALPMRHRIEHRGPGIRVEYAWRRCGRWESLSAVGSGEPQGVEAGSEAEFITEHYWGYTAGRSGSSEYQVEHPRWRIWKASEATFDADIAGLYGTRFVSSLSGHPTSAFIADGSPVAVRSKSSVLPGKEPLR